MDDICEYKLECSFEYHPIMHKDTHFQGMCDPFPQVEYEAFTFENDSMHESFVREGFQFQSNIFEHADQNFHNEQVIENEAGCYMHYESGVVDLVLPSELIHDANLIGETNRIDVSILPHENLDENQIYVRGKNFC